MISVDEHRDVAVGPGDTVVFSSRPIPGNERAVSRVIGNLFRRGCDVVHGGTAHVHVSGHASQDELVEMIQRVRPRYFVPIHGEYRMLAQHARLAVQAGSPADHVFVVEDGDVLVFAAGGARARTAACPPAASSSTAPASTSSRRSSCATAATSRRTGIVVPGGRPRPADGPPGVGAGDRDARLRGLGGVAPASWTRRPRGWSRSWWSRALRGALRPRPHPRAAAAGAAAALPKRGRSVVRWSSPS